MQFKITSIFDYTAWLLKRYTELQQTKESVLYRIIEIKSTDKIKIQVTGKSSVIECTPQDVVQNDLMLEGFSKKDVRTITLLSCEQVKEPKYKVVMQEFCDQFNQMMFRLKDNSADAVVIKTAAEIVMDKDMISQLSKDDVKSVSYVAGYESFLADRPDTET